MPADTNKDMATTYATVQCPGCTRPLTPRLLTCEHCHIKMEGHFELNEFASLNAEDLHFLRIFVRCEGRVRDMESALGLSYPTVRARLTTLKNKLQGAFTAAEQAQAAATESSAVQTILEALQAGALTFEQAMEQIKARKQKS